MRTLYPLSVLKTDATPFRRAGGSEADNETDFLELLWERAQTSPGKLAATALGLILLILVAGVTAAQSVAERAQGLDTTLHRAEPLTNVTLTLYTELSIADAVTGAVFLSPGLESQEMRDRYDKAIASASAATVQVAANTQSPQLLTISEELPVYTKLVESAKVYNRAGKPVGAAYLSQASHLMQTVILPAAEHMHRDQIDALEAAQEQQTQPPWALTLLLLAALGCLVLAQLRLARRSRRRFNPGLILSSGCFALLLLWFFVSSLFLVTLSGDGKSEGTDPLRMLTAARISVQQARTQETLQLLRRGDEDQLEQSYRASMASAQEQLDKLNPQQGEAGARQTAANAVKAWTKTHEQLRKDLTAGMYGESVELAIGPGPDACAAHYRALDTALTSDIEHSRVTLRDSVAGAREALTALAPATVVLTVCAAAFVVAGYWPRLGEYRA
ncbi:hypothetical protein [Segniliparus rugosus]|uniref:Chemotaxis methyl-accepting receptor HlyB-like 4HB MCP domain-containing protein n=1 Tax=Segniliparus rugosus (strain ATCC BAA-974 / DSM 45345 / CCUG 50838 / CIP 108380 / JCM 13579 / CDC 945) TaxID=679197 RepID=E5XVG4_SEGRC|nr:hypothetical protein [Segniliparus rugosus]EFV11662.2 hypothetical protein HMPREF9336_03486 [Segniliparus rugosus ATCC BAA-974]